MKLTNTARKKLSLSTRQL